MFVPHRAGSVTGDVSRLYTSENENTMSSKNVEVSKNRAFGTKLSNNNLKTPKSTRRRALGDISNRKTALGTAPAKQSLRPLGNRKDSNVLTPHRSKHSSSFVVPKTTGKTTTLGAAPVSSQRMVSFDLPSKSKLNQQEIKAHNAAPKIWVDTKEPVSDVELPAGRLWRHEQLENDDQICILDEVKQYKEELRVSTLEFLDRCVQEQNERVREQELKVEAQIQDWIDSIDGDYMPEPIEDSLEDEIISLGLSSDDDDDDFFNPHDIPL